MKARRFACYQLNNKRAIKNAENTAYFKRIRSVDPEDWSNFLLTRDLSSYDARDVPCSALLRDQKKRKFDSVTQFWHSCLISGTIGYLEWQREFTNAHIYESYKQFCTGITARVESSMQMFNKIRTLVRFENPTKKYRVNRVYTTKLPLLDEAKKQWCTKVDDPDWFLDDHDAVNSCWNASS